MATFTHDTGVVINDYPGEDGRLAARLIDTSNPEAETIYLSANELQALASYMNQEVSM